MKISSCETENVSNERINMKFTSKVRMYFSHRIIYIRDEFEDFHKFRKIKISYLKKMAYTFILFSIAFIQTAFVCFY